MSYIWDILIALITGIIAGFIVDYFARKREKKRSMYLMWMSFLMKALEKCEMYIDYGKLNNMPKFKNDDNTFKNAIFAIYDIIFPENHIEKEYTDTDNELFRNIQIAFNELNKWKDENRIRF